MKRNVEKCERSDLSDFRKCRVTYLKLSDVSRVT